LNNQGYIAKAPAEVVQKEREKLSEMEQSLSQLMQQRDSLAS
jgi:valyl-tRNA synthetase